MPGIRDVKWDYVATSGRHFDRNKFEDVKTRFNRFQEWDPDTGWSTRPTLESVGLKAAADELEQQGRLGAGYCRPFLNIGLLGGATPPFHLIERI
jgi:hypothetical protein